MFRYLVCVVALSLFASGAFAGNVTQKYNPPPDLDLKNCMFFLRLDGVSGALSAVTVLAADLGPGRSVVLPFNTNASQGKTGHVDAICEDLAGQISEVTATKAVTFPDLKPGAPELTDVQAVP